jgi:hypothetical protein
MARKLRIPCLAMEMSMKVLLGVVLVALAAVAGAIAQSPAAPSATDPAPASAEPAVPFQAASGLPVKRHRKELRGETAVINAAMHGPSAFRLSKTSDRPKDLRLSAR